MSRPRLNRAHRSATLPAVLVAGLAASVLPASALLPGAYASEVSATLTADPLAPTALTLHGGRADQEFGHVLNSEVCDVDADGLTDVTATGAVALGTTSFRDMAAQRRVDGHADALTDLPQWTNWTTNGRGGFACTGDVNADGFDDLVEVPLATSRFVAVEQSAGIRNAAGRLVQNRVSRYTFPAGATQLGARALGAAGDVDGDGLGDVLVSQHTASVALGATARAENGRLWVLRGQASATVPTGVTLRTLDATRNDGSDVALVVTGAAAGDRLGAAVSLGDVTGDGFDDLAVASDSGTVWLITGRAPTANTREVDLAQLDASDGRVLRTGTASVSDLAVGDLDGDDRADLVIGTDNSVVVLSDLAGAATARTVTGEQAGDEFGHAVAVVGDLDGNGSAELLVGAPGRDAGTGAAYVLDGTHTRAAQGHRIDGTRGEAQASDRASRFGSAVAALGDVDGNGSPDYAISAPGRSEHPTYRQGAVTVALTGELEGQLLVNVARRVGDDGVPVVDGDVLKASDVVDLRTNLRLSTQQGVAGEVALVVDGQQVATATTEVSAPHRAFAFFADVALPVGEHTLAVRSDAVAGARSAAATTGPRVLVTDETRTAVTVAGTGSDTTLEARVVTATDGEAVSAGTVTFVGADGTVIAADVAVVDGIARTAVAAGASRDALTGARAEFSGVRTTFDGADVALLARSSAAVAEVVAPPVVAPKATVKLSSTSARRGDVVRATVTFDRAVTDTVTVLVDGKAVGTARVAGRSVTIALPRLLTVGTRTVTVRTAGTAAAPAASATVRLAVTRTTTGAVKAVAKKFARGTRPRVTVTVGRASDGSRPVGTVKVTVGGKKTTAKLSAAKNGKVVVTLPGRRAAATAKVTFTPAATGTFTTPKSVRVKLTPRR